MRIHERWGSLGMITVALAGGCNVGLGDVSYTGGAGTGGAGTGGAGTGGAGTGGAGTGGATSSSSTGAGGAGCSAPVSDEFDGPSYNPCWKRLDPAAFAQLDIEQDAGASLLTARPAAKMRNAWYLDDHGPFIYQDVEDDFIIVTRLYTGTALDPAAEPTKAYNTAGLLARDPDGEVGDENWLLYDIGFQGEAGVGIGTMVKVTTTSMSDKLPQGSNGAHNGAMAICRYKGTFQVLKHLYDPDGAVEVADMPPTQWSNSPNKLQVGLTVGTYAPDPDIVGRFDHARFGVPTSLADCMAKFLALAP